MMDTNGSIGLLGILSAWGLADYHLAAASVAATLTAIYMAIAIVKRVK
jgi:hypothetical protein